MQRARAVLALGAMLLTGCDKLPFMKSTLKLNYAIEVQEEGGSTRKVSEDYRFRSGDGLRLLFKANPATHLYLFNRGTGQDDYTVLFPSRNSNLINPVKADADVLIPDRDWMRLDQSEGAESMVLVASTVPISSLEFNKGRARRDEFEAALGRAERQFAPESVSKTREGDWTTVTASGNKEMATVVRFTLRHE